MIKKLILPALVGVFTMFVACQSDPCADKICGTGGACFEGDCQCDPGYELDADGQCNVRTVDNLIGAYSVVEDCSRSNAATYLASISEVDATNIKIVNVWNLFQNPVNAVIKDATTITVARQEPDSDKYFVEGTGTISKNAAGKAIITWSYKVSDETGATPVVDDCTNTLYTHN